MSPGLWGYGQGSRGATGDGYAGSILVIDLGTATTSVLPTAKYREWGGGHGMGSALFWDLCEDKTVSGFDPGNVVTIMSSPLAGTPAPSASRCEVQGIGVQSTPEWFTRSNFGGRFASRMKSAGWDGIVVRGASPAPVWVNIEDSTVTFRDAKKDGLWGLETHHAQDRILELCGGADETGWRHIGSIPSRWTPYDPAVLVIGPAGERRSRIASLVHEAGSAADHGGFGGVWGAKNLKAIAVSGSRPVAVASADELLRARVSVKSTRAGSADAPVQGWGRFSATPRADAAFPLPAGGGGRPSACDCCVTACRMRYVDGYGNDSIGMATRILPMGEQGVGVAPDADVQRYAADLAHRYGINVHEAGGGVRYLLELFKKGVLGPGRLDVGLDWTKYGTMEFVEAYFEMIANRSGAGDHMAEGFWRAAKAWGRLAEDSADGSLPYPVWGLPSVEIDPRSMMHWAFGSLLGDRDINEKDFSSMADAGALAQESGARGVPDAETLVRAVAERMVPLPPDPTRLDSGKVRVSADAVTELTRWHRHYTRFWKQSALYCDNRFADWYSPVTPDESGFTPIGEPLFWNAVTGDDLTFEEGIDRGRRIWNLDNAIWTLQGRRRDAVMFAPYVHGTPFVPDAEHPVLMPMRTDGRWHYGRVEWVSIDAKFAEAVKTRFYTAEGWSVETGWPTRATLEDLGLGHVADTLEEAGRLGV